MVKKTVLKQSLTGDKRASQAASEEAINHFDDEMRALLHTPSEDELLRAGDLLCAKGRLLRFMGRMDEALAVFREGEKLPLVGRDPLFRARMRIEIGLTYAHSASYTEAKKELQTALLVTRRRGGHPQLTAVALNALGICAWGAGDFRKARRFYEETLGESRRAECAPMEAEALSNLALLDWKDGQLARALEGFRECLARWRKLGNRFAVALTLMNAGILEENLGRAATARRHYEQALALAGEVGFVQVQSATRCNLASLALAEGKGERALEESRQAAELARSIGDRRSQAIALENAALAFLCGTGIPVRDSEHGTGGPPVSEFEKTLAEARKLARAIGDRERLLSLELVEIEALIARGETKTLPTRLAAAREEVQKKGYEAERPRLARLEGQAALAAGDLTRALRLLAKALRECHRQGNRAEAKKIELLMKRMK